LEEEEKKKFEITPTFNFLVAYMQCTFSIDGTAPHESHTKGATFSTAHLYLPVICAVHSHAQLVDAVHNGGVVLANGSGTGGAP
jgi:hypothetical protein